MKIIAHYDLIGKGRQLLAYEPVLKDEAAQKAYLDKWNESCKHECIAVVVDLPPPMSLHDVRRGRS